MASKAFLGAILGCIVGIKWNIKLDFLLSKVNNVSNCWSYSILLFGFLTMDCPIIEIVTKAMIKSKDDFLHN